MYYLPEHLYEDMYAPGISFYSSIVSIDSHIDFFKNFEKRVKKKKKKKHST